jgi:hypothetical protein
MAETEAPTYEQATRCPKCEQPGEVTGKRPVEASLRDGIRIGTMLHTVYCRNERCTWNDTCWFVQVNPDGTVPAAKDHRGKPKKYENFPTDEQTKRVVDAVQRQLDAEMSGEGEIRNPHG